MESTNQVVQQTQLIQKKKSKLPLCLIVLGLLLVCCLCIGASIFYITTTPGVLKNTVFNQQNSNDQPKTELTQEEIEQYSSSYENKIANLESSQNTNETLVITEEELLAAFLKNDTSSIATQIGMSIHNGYAEFSIPLDGIFEGLSNNPEVQSQSNIDFSQFQGLLAGLTLNVEVAPSLDGKTIVLQDISTGNSLIDSMITDQVRESFNNGDYGSLEDISTIQGFTVNKIDFQEGQIVLNLVKL